MRIIFTRVIFPNLPPHMVKNLFQIIHFELKLMLFRLKGSWTAEFKSKRRSKLCFSLKLKIENSKHNIQMILNLGQFGFFLTDLDFLWCHKNDEFYLNLELWLLKFKISSCDWNSKRKIPKFRLPEVHRKSESHSQYYPNYKWIG